MVAVNSVYVSFWVITSTETRIRNNKHSVICYNVFITARLFFFRLKLKSYMSPFRASQRDVKNHSLWMFMDAADSLFVVTICEFLSLILEGRLLWEWRLLD